MGKKRKKLIEKFKNELRKEGFDDYFLKEYEIENKSLEKVDDSLYLDGYVYFAYLSIYDMNNGYESVDCQLEESLFRAFAKLKRVIAHDEDDYNYVVESMVI